MSLLDNFPHTCAASLVTWTRDSIGGQVRSYSTVFTGRACWRQLASQGEIEEFEKRGMSVSDKIYFLTDPQLDFNPRKAERFVVDVSKMHARSTTTGTDRLEVRSKAVPDATAGLGVVYRLFVGAETTSDDI